MSWSSLFFGGQAGQKTAALDGESFGGEAITLPSDVTAKMGVIGFLEAPGIGCLIGGLNPTGRPEAYLVEGDAGSELFDQVRDVAGLSGQEGSIAVRDVLQRVVDSKGRTSRVQFVNGSQSLFFKRLGGEVPTPKAVPSAIALGPSFRELAAKGSWF